MLASYHGHMETTRMLVERRNRPSPSHGRSTLDAILPGLKAQ